MEGIIRENPQDSCSATGVGVEMLGKIQKFFIVHGRHIKVAQVVRWGKRDHGELPG
jgi:hypothetical protein